MRKEGRKGCHLHHAGENLYPSSVQIVGISGLTKNLQNEGGGSDIFIEMEEQKRVGGIENWC